MQNYTFRLTSGQDLFDSIQAFVMKKHVQAGCILPKDTAPGRCERSGQPEPCRLRLADRDYNSEYNDVIYKRELAEDSGYEESAIYYA